MRTERNRWHTSWSYTWYHTLLPTLCHCGNIALQNCDPGVPLPARKETSSWVASWDSMVTLFTWWIFNPSPQTKNDWINFGRVHPFENKQQMYGRGEKEVPHLFLKLGKICQWSTELPEVSKTLHVASSGRLVAHWSCRRLRYLKIHILYEVWQ